MKTYNPSLVYFSAAALAFLFSCAKEPKYAAPVDPVAVIISDARVDLLSIPNKIIITSQIISAGDGVVEYGHVWSNEKPRPDYNNDNKEEIFDRRKDTVSFTSEIILQSQANTYYVRAYVKDIYDRDVVSHSDSVFTFVREEKEELDPTFNIVMPPSPCTAPCTVQFEMNDQSNTDFVWSFGDGAVDSTNKNPAHTYATSDTFEVVLTVRNGGEPSSDTQYVEIGMERFALTFPAYREGVGIFPMADGGFVVAGNMNSDSDSKIVLMRTNKEGKLEGAAHWKKEGRGLSDADVAKDVIRLRDGTYALVGFTVNEGEAADIIYIRFDESGNILAEERYERTQAGNDFNHLETISILQLPPPSARVMIAGAAELAGTEDGENVFFEFFEPNYSGFSGARRFERDGIEKALGAAVLGSGDFLITGVTGEGAGQQAFAFVADFFGGFSVPFTMLDGQRAEGAAIRNPSELLIYGTTFDASAFETDLLIAVTGPGLANFDYIPPHFPAQNGFESLLAIEILPDGSFAGAGEKAGNGLLIRYDPLNAYQWHTEVDKGGFEKLNAVKLTPDNGLAATGISADGLLLVKTGEDGNYQ